MQCDVEGCENIMCDQYIEDVGYICDDCLEDLKNYLVDKELCFESLFDFFGTHRYNKNTDNDIDSFIEDHLIKGRD